uniref:DMAP-interaction domain-containing protein n=1 Tax=Mesocestoides corti TaxID=53468 RepID=A0A5K3G0L6_MESCO
MGEVDLIGFDADLRKKLAELDLELAEGDITEKGYQKKKAKIIEQFRKQHCQRKFTKFFLVSSFAREFHVNSP